MKVLLLFISLGVLCHGALHESHKKHRRNNIGRTMVPCPDSASKICFEFGDVSINGINKQINTELSASYAYQSMANYFARDDVALPGISKFFKKASVEESEHAQKFIDYVTKRGGRVELDTVKKPAKSTWSVAVDAFRDALALEQDVTKSILDLHHEAANDAHLQDFLEGEFLTEQVDGMKQLGDMITKLERLGNGVGLHIFDEELNK